MVTLDPTDKTAGSVAVQRVVDLVTQGRTLDQAKREAGVTPEFVRRLGPLIRARVAEVLENFSMEDDVAQAVVRARLNEMMLDADPSVALPAIKEVKKLHGMDKPVKVDLGLVPRPPDADTLENEA